MTVLGVAALLASLMPASQNSEPQWIWSGSKRVPGERAVIGRKFTPPENIRSARLRAVADFAALALSFNGRRIAESEAYGPLIELDAIPLLKRGENRILIDARAVPGPAAVALELRFTLADGHVLTIGTDGDWRVAGTPDRRPATFGALASEAWWNLAPITINELDDYTQWKRAIASGKGTDPATFEAKPGYAVELLRSALKDEGSWVSLAFDPEGRLTVAREDRGLLRFSFSGDRKEIESAETIDDTLRECRGLVYAHGSLYVNANDSRGFYRLRDTDGDGTFDESKRLVETPGGDGHGRNDLALGPDGKIYAIHGDAVRLPKDGSDRMSPLRRNHPPFRPNEGHVTRIDPDGANREIFCGGLRNPYGIAFNADGEAFTYDADAETDMGVPWYRPTRVNHLTSGADFGWRAVTGSWPPYYPDHPDNARPTLTIGKGSPTAVKFGTKSSFPDPYREALFVLDWAYGRILAVHFIPRGAGYLGRAEVFLRGRPLNVTDLGFGPDGALYFVTGGRKTQSGLYRVRYVGPESNPRALTSQEKDRAEASRKSRERRRRLEAFHGDREAGAVESIWSGLVDPDPRIRYAARIALEHQPLSRWRERARQDPSIEALTAWLKACPPEETAEVLSLLNGKDLAALPLHRKLSILHLYHECFGRLPELTDGVRTATLERLGPLFPGRSSALNRALAPLLARLSPKRAVPEILDLTAASTDPWDLIHYVFALRNLQEGWTPERRESYFRILATATGLPGGRGKPKAMANIRKDAFAALSDDEKKRFAEALDVRPPPPPLPDLARRRVVRAWSMKDFADVLDDPGKRDADSGRKLFDRALCSRCHRLGSQGYALGPDLTSVGSRFNRRDLLEAILEPSKVVADVFRTDIIRLKDGQILTGQIVPQLDYRSPELLLAPSPFEPHKTTKVRKADIDSHRRSDLSLMPTGLVNILERDEILDLLAWIESGGRPE